MSFRAQDEVKCLSPKELKELLNWIDAVPLSRQKKNLARDFSDGVAVAKIVQFYLPKMVELQMHNYVNAQSAAQKRINWALLGKKVFSKLNVKLDEKLVESVIEAKAGAIELILRDLKRKVVELSPMSQVNLGAQQSGRSLFRRTASQHPSEKRVTPAPFASAQSAVIVSAAPSSAPASRQGRLPPKDVASKVNSNNRPPPAHRNKAHARALQQAKKVDETKVKEPEGQAESQKEGQSTELPEADKAITGPEVDENANEDQSVLPPAQLVYKGHVMIPAVMIDVKNKQVTDMESIISSLTKKVNFLDSLLIQKDERLEQMAQELLQVKSQVAVQPESTPTFGM